MENEERYYEMLSAAYLKGRAKRLNAVHMLPEFLQQKEPEELTAEEREALPELFQQLELKRYPFKRGREELPRVRKVMGFLQSVQPESLLDVGSGRGVFLFPFLEAFPWAEVTAIDLLPKRVEFLQDLNRGGIRQLTAKEADLCSQPFPDDSFDVVTLLEVLEHIPAVEQAVAAAVRMARRYVVVTVPSKPDNNPEHIHLLTQAWLTELFHQAGCRRLHFDGVTGHLFLAASLEKK